MRRHRRFTASTRSRRGQFAAVVAASVALGAVAAAAWLRTPGAPRSRPTPPRPPSSPVFAPAATTDVYASTKAVRADIAHDRPVVYVPSGIADTVTEIDPRTMHIVGAFTTGPQSTPQHIVPSWDLHTLWVLNNKSDQVIPIVARTGHVLPPIAVTDPYNMYFTPDGREAIVVEELHGRLDIRDPHTMALRFHIATPGCAGANHADFDASGRYMVLTCEYNGRLAKVDLRARRVIAYLTLPTPAGRAPVSATMPDGSSARSMPQDVRLSDDGRAFYVADMLQGGVHVIDVATFSPQRFIATGVGAHSVTPDHDGNRLYVANRGSSATRGRPHAQGSVSVIDTTTDRVVATWVIPHGGSPDMGNLTADGRQLWLSGRFDSEVYVFDTITGRLERRIAVPLGPHGLAVWPQPGRFSLGHTGNMR